MDATLEKLVEGLEGAGGGAGKGEICRDNLSRKRYSIYLAEGRAR